MEQQGLPISIMILFVGVIHGAMTLVGLVVALMLLA